MALHNCDYCGKVFNSAGSRVCPECSKLLDEVYMKVRKYIYQDSRSANFSNIVENTGVPEKALSHLINQGRISLGNRMAGGIKCRICGKEAEDGVLCDRCKDRLRSEKLFSQLTGTTDEGCRKTGSRVLPLNQK